MENKKPHILVADDSRIVTQKTREILQAVGYQVSIAEDGEKALDSIMVNEFDLVLLDIEMPRMDGFQVFKRVRALDNFKTLPIIIFFTERTSLKLEGLQLGASDFILKSLVKTNTTEFHARIEAHLKISVLIRRHIEFAQQTILQAAATSACHEIYNPLTPISAGIDFILSHHGEEERCRQCIAMLKPGKESVQRIKEVVRKFSDVKKPVTKKYAGGGQMIDFENSEGPADPRR